MNVIPAGHDGDIYWRNVGLRHQAKRSGTIMSIIASIVLCFFWSIPMAFISSLTEIGTIKMSLPKLGQWIEQHPLMEKVLAQLAPMLLLIFNETILPTTLKYFATWEGHISSSLLEASLFVKLGCFMVRMFILYLFMFHNVFFKTFVGYTNQK
jgi:calcium permeable stress-gated cation channel